MGGLQQIASVDGGDVWNASRWCCIRLPELLQKASNALIIFPACNQKSNTEEVLYPRTCGKRFEEQRSTAPAGCCLRIPPKSFGSGELCYS